MSAPHYPRLVGDVGGTHARLAWIDAPGGELVDFTVYRCDAFASLADVIAIHVQRHPRPGPLSCALGVATAVTGDHVQFTNHQWSFSIQALRDALGFERLLVVNDFTALALSLPDLPAAERRRIGPAAASELPADEAAPVAVIGPGTGLGVSAMLPSRGGWVPISGEGGHVTLAAVTPREIEVVNLLQKQFGHASAERALSGQGLVNLYHAVVSLRRAPKEALTPEDVTTRALAGDPACVEVVDLFFALLGTVSGDLVLTLGARGGLYLGGGIVPRLGDWIDRSRFRERFESKGRFAAYLKPVPTWLITAKRSPALRGAGVALDRE